MSQHTYEPHCPFCKIVRGEIPSSKVLETDDAVAFLDINPVNPGHVLLVPKSHHSNLTDLPDLTAAHLGALVPRLCRAVQAATRSDGFHLVVNNGRAAGQTVDHGHWHIIPRFYNDPVHWPWPHSQYAGDELSQIQGRIERELNPPSSDA
ncbi:HIT family protein [Singulisphaera sp. Ch08]|uniref:HIT family protein n=1 Tax=Singulisphaera sp. Ch08 TaxID=3120278 RepID=A0AAU7CJ57_9BACT